MIHSKEYSKKSKFRKVSTRGILYVPNIYLINFQIILYTLIFFYKNKDVKIVQCCNGCYMHVSNIVKTSIYFCYTCPLGTSRILETL